MIYYVLDILTEEIRFINIMYSSNQRIWIDDFDNKLSKLNYIWSSNNK